MDRVCPGIYPVPGTDILATGRAVLEKITGIDLLDPRVEK